MAEMTWAELLRKQAPRGRAGSDAIAPVCQSVVRNPAFVRPPPCPLLPSNPGLNLTALASEGDVNTPGAPRRWGPEDTLPTCRKKKKEAERASLHCPHILPLEHSSRV